MNLLKTLRQAAYVLLGMLGLMLSASAQDYTRQNAIDDATQFATEQAAAGKLTQNQSNLWIALSKGSAGWAYDNFSDNLQFDNNGNLLNGTALQQNYVGTFNKLYAVLTDPNTGELNEQLSKQALNQLSPGIYTTLPTILFNSANVQNTQIQQRLWAVRAGLSEDPSVAPVADGGKSATMSGKKVVAPAVEPEQKWVTFIDGNGMWSQAQSVNNLPGYNSYAGGVQAGASYELFKNFSVGPYVGYQGTKVNFNGSNGGGSSATDNSVRYGLFGEYRKGGWYNDGIIGGAYNSVAVNHGISISGNGYKFNNMANGNVSGGEFDSMYGTGYEFKAGKLTFGPATSLQYTYMNLSGTQETGGSQALAQNIGSQSASSLLYTLGGQASYNIDLTQSVKLQPFLSLAWQHEFLQNGYGVNSSILGQSYNYQTTNAGRDQYIAGIGGNLVLTKSLSAYAVCNLLNSDAQIFSQAISGGINLKF
jgi:outer membrane autotransporter protein